MATIKVLRGNTSSIANYAGQAGEVALNYETGNLVFWTNTANVYYTFGVAATPTVWTFQGTSAGYLGGGRNAPTGTFPTAIQKYSYTSDGNSTVIPANSNIQRQYAVGASSPTDIYFSGGLVAGNAQTDIERYPTATEDTRVSSADLATGVYISAGASSETNGYVFGGRTPSYTDILQKFSFQSDSNATNIGQLTQPTAYNAGVSSSYFGYRVGGDPAQSTIEKFPYVSDTSATDVGELVANDYALVTQNSDTHGYVTGGTGSVPTIGGDRIQKFPFSSDTGATDIAELAVALGQHSGTSSTTHGYIAGSQPDPANHDIQKFSFSSDANGTDIGQLNTPLIRAAQGTQA